MTVSPKKGKPVYAGLSITQHTLEMAVFNPKSFAIERSVSVPTPVGVFDADGDSIINPQHLKEALSHLVRGVGPSVKAVHLSLPGTLLRMVEMPRMEAQELYVSLSSEAERYKAFDDTEAIVDFSVIQNPNLPANLQQVVFGAVRSDTLVVYRQILKQLKLKIVSITLEPLNILRAMAGTGVLDALVQQVGADSTWGTIFVEPMRVRISLWQGNRLLELRETSMDTSEFASADPDSIMVEDLLEEIRRTSKNFQPAIWLTGNMPYQMEQVLSNRLHVPFRDCPLGDAMSLDNPSLQLATVGSAMTSTVAFPFEFNLLAGLGKVGAPAGSAAAVAEIPGEESPTPTFVIAGGAVAIALSLLLTAGLFVANEFFLKSQVANLQQTKDQEAASISLLQVKERELKEKVEVDTRLLDMVTHAKIRNHIYVALTDDLIKKKPGNIWIYSVSVDDRLAMLGKALSHQEVIDFARSFDATPYVKSVLIDSIKESVLHGTRVFDFKIGGNVHLDPALIAPDPNDTTAVDGKVAPPKDTGV